MTIAFNWCIVCRNVRGKYALGRGDRLFMKKVWNLRVLTAVIVTMALTTTAVAYTYGYESPYSEEPYSSEIPYSITYTYEGEAPYSSELPYSAAPSLIEKLDSPVAQCMVLNVIVPLSFDFTIDLFERAGRGQIFSDIHLLRNVGNIDAYFVITDASVVFVDYYGEYRPVNDELFIALNFGRDDIVPLVLTDETETMPRSIFLPAVGCESSTAFLSFSGGINLEPGQVVDWLEYTVRLHISYILLHVNHLDYYFPGYYIICEEELYLEDEEIYECQETYDENEETCYKYDYPHEDDECYDEDSSLTDDTYESEDIKNEDDDYPLDGDEDYDDNVTDNAHEDGYQATYDFE